ncbi:MAG: hypothetical protein ACJ73D_01955 [Pyrinomonadaceae bacterium]
MRCTANTRSSRILRSAPAVLFALLVASLVHPQDLATSRVDGSQASNENFRAELVHLPGGAEIVTIFVRKASPEGDLPLVSVLRDTLGDTNRANDRLRYIWLHTYTRPSMRQRLASVLPFLYARTGNKTGSETLPPPPVMDLTGSTASSGRWQVLRRVVLAVEACRFVKAGVLQYHQNKEDYRRTAVATAMAVLSMYEQSSTEKILDDRELHDIQARLGLTTEFFGSYMQPENLGRAYDKQLAKQRDDRAQNWELLRQESEHQGLIFEPLKMPDGTPRNAVVWVREDDLKRPAEHKWAARFLNIKDPWTDSSLQRWEGYRAERWYDADDRQVDPGSPGAVKHTLIPLAVYGLDNPKIPAILVDFRSNANPKKREASRRVVSDIVDDFASVTQFGGLQLVAGKAAVDWIIHRRGIDIYQQSRLTSYAGLKLLLELDDSLDPAFKTEVAKRVESATLNPLQNDVAIEERLARAQYDNLMFWATDDNGLAAKLRRDRREEMVRINHAGAPSRLGFSLAHLATFGAYTHRETDTSEMLEKVDRKRQLDYHERILREISARTNAPEIDSNFDALKTSLAFLSSQGSEASGKTAKALEVIFRKSGDDGVRSLCIAGLYKINTETAKRQLIAIYNDGDLSPHLRTATAYYLKLAAEEGQRMSKDDARAVAAIPALN